MQFCIKIFCFLCSEGAAAVSKIFCFLCPEGAAAVNKIFCFLCSESAAAVSKIFCLLCSESAAAVSKIFCFLCSEGAAAVSKIFSPLFYLAKSFSAFILCSAIYSNLIHFMFGVEYLILLRCDTVSLVM